MAKKSRNSIAVPVWLAFLIVFILVFYTLAIFQTDNDPQIVGAQEMGGGFGSGDDQNWDKYNNLWDEIAGRSSAFSKGAENGFKAGQNTCDDNGECSFCDPRGGGTFNECKNFCKCLSSNTLISTPNGEINVKNLKEGLLVWTQDENGNKVSAPIVQLRKLPVSQHQVVHLVLTDGREVWVSPSHPDVNGSNIGDIQVGDDYDNSVVVKADLVDYQYSHTYDLLPAGATGHYWANDVLMGSTLTPLANACYLEEINW